mmetsp:Transcript_13246/g.34040  ORF Transcript_13246/g.34040 Transcript_13246/m.34040 type:complete len:168 (+) Transcript_13246:80-583(+)
MPGRQCYVAEGFATAADGGQLAWRLSRPSDDTGRCGAPLVLLNGLANDDSQWGAYFAAWEDARRAFLYWDYRGHGRSPPAARPQDITISSQASDLQAVLAAAEAQEPSVDLSSFVLVAYSLGAQVPPPPPPPPPPYLAYVPHSPLLGHVATWAVPRPLPAPAACRWH